MADELEGSRAVGDGKTSNFALDEVGSVVDVTLDEVLALDGGDGRSDIALALRAVADDDDILELLVVRCEADAHALGGGQLLSGVADEGEDEGRALRCLDGEVAVEVGDGTGGRALIKDGDSYGTGWLLLLSTTRPWPRSSVRRPSQT